MDKAYILKEIISYLEKDLLGLKESALIAHEAATNEESKPENEYDTRALEASYIASAQSKRAANLEESLSLLKRIQVKDYSQDEKIYSTALVKLESNNIIFFVFLIPNNGGFTIKVNNQKVQVISPHSPMGEALMGLKKNDVATVEFDDGTFKEYLILDVQ